MVASLINGLDGTRTPGELATDTARFRMALTSPGRRPTPRRCARAWKRARASGFYLIEVLYRVIPVLRNAGSAIAEVYGAVPEVAAAAARALARHLGRRRHGRRSECRCTHRHGHAGRAATRRGSRAT